MSLAMQWLVIPPLALLFYFAVRKSHSAQVADEPHRATKDGTWRSRARRVISTFGFVQWSSLTLVTIFLIALIGDTLITLL